MRRYLKSAVEMATAKGVQVTETELNFLMVVHSAVVAVATLAMSLSEGAIYVLAICIEIAFLWAMYYRLCKKLNVDVKQNLGKWIGSAIIANVCSSILGQIVGNGIAAIGSNIGIAGVIIAVIVADFCITYLSGMFFLGMLFRMFKVEISPR